MFYYKTIKNRTEISTITATFWPNRMRLCSKFMIFNTKFMILNA